MQTTTPHRMSLLIPNDLEVLESLVGTLRQCGSRITTFAVSLNAEANLASVTVASDDELDAVRALHQDLEGAGGVLKSKVSWEGLVG